MIGFTYTYKSSNEILESIPGFLSMGVFDIILVSTTLISLFLFIFFLIPLFLVTREHIQKKKDKKNKKKILTQILLQKELEDEIEKEVKIESEGNTIR